MAMPMVRASGLRSTGLHLFLIVAGVALGGALAAPPASGQTVRVTTQASIGTTCVEPGCECIDETGAPATCPATHVRNYDSGEVVGTTSDLHIASVSGTLVGYDATTTSSMESQADASFGLLKGLTQAAMEATGSYVAAGGLAISGTASSYASVEFSDYAIASAPMPGGTITLSYKQNISSSDSAALGGGGLSIDPCLANGDATTHLDAVMVVSPLISGGGGNVSYSRLTSECGPPQIIGSPIDTITVTVNDGERVNFGQLVTLRSYARMDGGLGFPTNPNRALSADALLDASNTAHLYIEVLTPGGSYQSGSGTVYEVPEPGAEAAAASAIASLLAAVRLRRGR